MSAPNSADSSSAPSSGPAAGLPQPIGDALPRPQWIAKAFPANQGQDHLGLGSVSSDQILPTLSPAINVLTIHPRYHSFYVFLLDEFWRRDRPRTPREWISFFRPREYIFSVGALLCDRPEHGDLGNVVGSQKTWGQAQQRLATYDTGFNYIKSDLGGYGLYYRSVMAELGLIYPGGPGFPYPIDVPTEQGKAVAAAFRTAVQDTAYYRHHFDHDATQVPLKDIGAYIRQACLCQLQVDSAPDQSLLRDVFLHGGAAPQARRDTFRLLLDLADQTERHAIDQDAFRQLLYFRATDGGATHRPREDIGETAERWRLYQAREYYAFALNALWSHLCGWGLANNGDVRPLPLDHFWAHLETALDFDPLAARCNLPPPRLQAGSSLEELLAWLRATVGGNESDFDQRCTIDAPLNEHRLYRLAKQHRQAPEITVAGMISLLGMIALRFGQPERWLTASWGIARMGSEGRLSLDGFLRVLRQRRRAGQVTIGAIARWLYADYVIFQHQIVATGKLPGSNTFRFQREGDRLRFFPLGHGVDFNDSRFTALSTTIHELGFCGDLATPSHPLTGAGRRLLDEGDLL